MMKKRIITGIVVLGVICALVGCGEHKHKWVEATCTERKHCSECGEETGVPLGHEVNTWTIVTEATCTEYGKEQGVCERCGEIIERTSELKPLGHNVNTWEKVTEATCTESGLERGICERCGKTVERGTEKIAHTPGEWEIETAATISSSGKRVQKCIVCGEIVYSETYDLTDAEKAEAYKSSCTYISYDELARNPDSYMFEKVYFYGRVVQVMDGNGFTAFRINVTNDGWGYYDDTVYVEYHGTFDNGRILEDDMVTFYGESYGLYSYTTVLGATVTIPAVVAEYIIR